MVKYGLSMVNISQYCLIYRLVDHTISFSFREKMEGFNLLTTNISLKTLSQLCLFPKEDHHGDCDGIALDLVYRKPGLGVQYCCLYVTHTYLVYNQSATIHCRQSLEMYIHMQITELESTMGTRSKARRRKPHDCAKDLTEHKGAPDRIASPYFKYRQPISQTVKCYQVADFGDIYRLQLLSLAPGTCPSVEATKTKP